MSESSTEPRKAWIVEEVAGACDRLEDVLNALATDGYTVRDIQLLSYDAYEGPRFYVTAFDPELAVGKAASASLDKFLASIGAAPAVGPTG